MRKLFANFLLCLVVSASVLSAAPQQRGRRSEMSTARVVFVTAVRLLEWRLGIRPASDGLTPPFPAPAAKPTNCCK